MNASLSILRRYVLVSILNLSYFHALFLLSGMYDSVDRWLAMLVHFLLVLLPVLMLVLSWW